MSKYFTLKNLKLLSPFDVALETCTCAFYSPCSSCLKQFLFAFLLYLRFKNVIFEISPSEVVGVFDVKAKLMGVHLETVMLEYQVPLQRLSIYSEFCHIKHYCAAFPKSQDVHV